MRFIYTSYSLAGDRPVWWTWRAMMENTAWLWQPGCEWTTEDFRINLN